MDGWIFMLSMNLLFPVVLVGLGYHYKKHAPTERNAWFGYRTPLSIQNQDTWRFAQDYCGRAMRKGSVVGFVLALVGMGLLYGKSKNAIAFGGAFVSLLELFVIIGITIFTEHALHKTFDESGRRKNDLNV